MTEVTSEVRAYMRHVRTAEVCATGVKDFFAFYNLDLRDFGRNGIPAETLEATQNPTAMRVAAVARQESADGR